MSQNNHRGSLIQIEDMTKVYQMGDIQVHALRGVSLTVEKGEYVAIMGSSGSGKSTLMNMIGLLDRPTGGSYKIRGKESSELSKGKLADLHPAHNVAHVADDLVGHHQHLHRRDGAIFRVESGRQSVPAR